MCIFPEAFILSLLLGLSFCHRPRKSMWGRTSQPAPIWIGELLPFLCSLIIKVKNAHVAEQLHRPGLFNRFLVNYISSWIPSRSLMIFLKVTSFNSLEKFTAVSGGCDFTLIKWSFVHRLLAVVELLSDSGTWGCTNVDGGAGPSSWQMLRLGVLAVQCQSGQQHL